MAQLRINLLNLQKVGHLERGSQESNYVTSTVCTNASTDPSQKVECNGVFHIDD
jgi:hypothetical protein